MYIRGFFAVARGNDPILTAQMQTATNDTNEHE
jgi:hypothetical protein